MLDLKIEELPEDAIIDDDMVVLQATSITEPNTREIVSRDTSPTSIEIERLTLSDSPRPPRKRRPERQSIVSGAEAHINKTRKT